MRSARDDGLWDDELSWYLTCRDAACGYSSTLGGLIATIERGISASRMPNSDPYRSDQVGFGPQYHGRGAFGIDRRMRARWLRLDRGTREVLLAHYVAHKPDPIEPEAEWEPGKDAPAVSYSRDFGTARYRREFTGRRAFPPGVESRLGKLAGAAIFLTPREGLARLLKACAQGDEREVSKARQRADRAVRKAHATYYAVVTAEVERERSKHWREQWVELRAELRHRDSLADLFEVIADESVVDFAHRDTDGIWR